VASFPKKLDKYPMKDDYSGDMCHFYPHAIDPPVTQMDKRAPGKAKKAYGNSSPELRVVQDWNRFCDLARVFAASISRSFGGALV
jgi:hypothetical protein